MPRRLPASGGLQRCTGHRPTCVAAAGAEAGEPPSTVDVFYHHIGSFRLCCSRVGGPVAGPGPPVARLSVLRLKRAPHPIASRADSIILKYRFITKSIVKARARAARRDPL